MRHNLKTLGSCENHVHSVLRMRAEMPCKVQPQKLSTSLILVIVIECNAKKGAKSFVTRVLVLHAD
jgi:hypothetical protein